MYHQEHKIAQAEHAAFLARFYRAPLEGVTVHVPNIFDRIFAAIKGLLKSPEPACCEVAPMQEQPAE
jgi:hypothetical protein